MARAIGIFLFLLFQQNVVLAQAPSFPPAQSQPPTDDHEWLVPARDYASTRFSPLNQVNTSNVKDLKVAWTFSTAVNRGQEGAPLVHGDTMYVVSP